MDDPKVQRKGDKYHNHPNIRTDINDRGRNTRTFPNRPAEEVGPGSKRQYKGGWRRWEGESDKRFWIGRTKWGRGETYWGLRHQRTENHEHQSCFKKPKRRLYILRPLQMGSISIRSASKKKMEEYGARCRDEAWDWLGIGLWTFGATTKLKLKRTKRAERQQRFVCKWILPEYRGNKEFEVLNLEEATNLDDMCKGMKKTIRETAIKHVPRWRKGLQKILIEGNFFGNLW